MRYRYAGTLARIVDRPTFPIVRGWGARPASRDVSRLDGFLKWLMMLPDHGDRIFAELRGNQR